MVKQYRQFDGIAVGNASVDNEKLTKLVEQIDIVENLTKESGLAIAEMQELEDLLVKDVRYLKTIIEGGVVSRDNVVEDTTDPFSGEQLLKKLHINGELLVNTKNVVVDGNGAPVIVQSEPGLGLHDVTLPPIVNFKLLPYDIDFEYTDRSDGYVDKLRLVINLSTHEFKYDTFWANINTMNSLKIHKRFSSEESHDGYKTNLTMTFPLYDYTTIEEVIELKNIDSDDISLELSTDDDGNVIRTGSIKIDGNKYSENTIGFKFLQNTSISIKVSVMDADVVVGGNTYNDAIQAYGYDTEEYNLIESIKCNKDGLFLDSLKPLSGSKYLTIDDTGLIGTGQGGVGGGSMTFVGLNDTPTTIGTAGQIVRVNDNEDALEFTNYSKIKDDEIILSTDRLDNLNNFIRLSNNIINLEAREHIYINSGNQVHVSSSKGILISGKSDDLEPAVKISGNNSLDGIGIHLETEEDICIDSRKLKINSNENANILIDYDNVVVNNKSFVIQDKTFNQTVTIDYPGNDPSNFQIPSQLIQADFTENKMHITDTNGYVQLFMNNGTRSRIDLTNSEGKPAVKDPKNIWITNSLPNFALYLYRENQVNSPTLIYIQKGGFTIRSSDNTAIEEKELDGELYYKLVYETHYDIVVDHYFLTGQKMIFYYPQPDEDQLDNPQYDDRIQTHFFKWYGTDDDFNISPYFSVENDITNVHGQLYINNVRSEPFTESLKNKLESINQNGGTTTNNIEGISSTATTDLITLSDTEGVTITSEPIRLNSVIIDNENVTIENKVLRVQEMNLSDPIIIEYPDDDSINYKILSDRIDIIDHGGYAKINDGKIDLTMYQNSKYLWITDDVLNYTIYLNGGTSTDNTHASLPDVVYIEKDNDNNPALTISSGGTLAEIETLDDDITYYKVYAFIRYDILINQHFLTPLKFKFSFKGLSYTHFFKWYGSYQNEIITPIFSVNEQVFINDEVSEAFTPELKSKLLSLELSAGAFTPELKTKLLSIEDNANNYKVSGVSSSATSEVLTLSDNEIIIRSNNVKINEEITEAFTPQLKAKLLSIEDNANNYELSGVSSSATSEVLTLSDDEIIIRSNNLKINGKFYEEFTPELRTKLLSIEDNANNYTLAGVNSSASANSNVMSITDDDFTLGQFSAIKVTSSDSIVMKSDFRFSIDTDEYFINRPGNRHNIDMPSTSRNKALMPHETDGEKTQWTFYDGTINNTGFLIHLHSSPPNDGGEYTFRGKNFYLTNTIYLVRIDASSMTNGNLIFKIAPSNSVSINVTNGTANEFIIGDIKEIRIDTSGTTTGGNTTFEMVISQFTTFNIRYSNYDYNFSYYGDATLESGPSLEISDPGIILYDNVQLRGNLIAHDPDVTNITLENIKINNKIENNDKLSLFCDEFILYKKSDSGNQESFTSKRNGITMHDNVVISGDINVTGTIFANGIDISSSSVAGIVSTPTIDRLFINDNGISLNNDKIQLCSNDITNETSNQVRIEAKSGGTHLNMISKKLSSTPTCNINFIGYNSDGTLISTTSTSNNYNLGSIIVSENVLQLIHHQRIKLDATDIEFAGNIEFSEISSNHLQIGDNTTNLRVYIETEPPYTNGIYPYVKFETGTNFGSFSTPIKTLFHCQPDYIEFYDHSKIQMDNVDFGVSDSSKIANFTVRASDTITLQTDNELIIKSKDVNYGISDAEKIETYTVRASESITLQSDNGVSIRGGLIIDGKLFSIEELPTDITYNSEFNQIDVTKKMIIDNQDFVITGTDTSGSLDTIIPLNDDNNFQIPSTRLQNNLIDQNKFHVSSGDVTSIYAEEIFVNHRNDSISSGSPSKNERIPLAGGSKNIWITDDVTNYEFYLYPGVTNNDTIYIEKDDDYNPSLSITRADGSSVDTSIFINKTDANGNSLKGTYYVIEAGGFEYNITINNYFLNRQKIFYESSAFQNILHYFKWYGTYYNTNTTFFSVENGNVNVKGEISEAFTPELKAKLLSIEDNANNYKLAGVSSTATSEIMTLADNGVSITTGLTINGTEAVTSDSRWKSHQQPLTNNLDVISNLSPLIYRKHSEQVNDENINEENYKIESGLFAQDVEAMDELKHLVKVPDNLEENPRSLNYNGIIPYLIGAIQELQEQNRELRAMITNKVS